MNRSHLHSVGIVCASLAFLCGGPLASTAGEAKDTESFRLTVREVVDYASEGKQKRWKSDTDIDYTLRRRGQEVRVIIDLIRLVVTTDAGEFGNVTLSRAGIIDIFAGKKKEIRFENAPEKTKARLKDSFGVPLCKITLDRDGREIKRVIIAGPGAKQTLEEGRVAAARLFHAPFPAEKKRWTAPVELPMGNDTYARGELTYEKALRDRDSRTTVNVSGSLVGDGAKLPGGARFKKARYDVKGEQVYDAASHEWSSGDLLATFLTETVLADGEVRSAKGTMRIKLQRNDAK
jgi:hypothetical protein